MITGQSLTQSLRQRHRAQNCFQCCAIGVWMVERFYAKSMYPFKQPFLHKGPHFEWLKSNWTANWQAVSCPAVVYSPNIQLQIKQFKQHWGYFCSDNIHEGLFEGSDLAKVRLQVGLCHQEPWQIQTNKQSIRVWHESMSMWERTTERERERELGYKRKAF